MMPISMRWDRNDKEFKLFMGFIEVRRNASRRTVK